MKSVSNHVAGYEMTGADLLEYRFLFFANTFFADASRIETATRGRVDRRGDLPR